MSEQQIALESQSFSQEVLSKPMFSVHISNDISLFARKVMNSLIQNVHNAESSGTSVFTDQYGFKYYEITFRTIEGNLALEKYHQKQDIISALEELMRTLITFNVFGRDKKFKGSLKPTFQDVTKTTLLSNVRYREFFDQQEERKNSENNKIYYAFTPTMLEAILSPIPYGKISFDIQNKLHSKYSLAMWEMLKTEIDVQRTDTCKTQIMTIQRFQEVIAGSKSGYSEFKRINDNLIKKPLKEVNEKTNLTAKLILHKEGRRVSGVQFEATLKEKEGEENIKNIPHQPRTNVIFKLKKYILDDKIISSILRDYPDDNYIIANLEAVIGNPKMSVALIRAALRDDYAGCKSNGDLFSCANKTTHEFIESKAMVVENKNEPTSLNASKTDYKKNRINEILIKEGISEMKRKEFVSRYSEKYILENIEEANNYAKKKKAEASAPLYIKAIEENWANYGEEKERMKQKQELIFELDKMLFWGRFEKDADIKTKHNYIGNTICVLKRLARWTENDCNDWWNNYYNQDLRQMCVSFNEFRSTIIAHLADDFKKIDNILLELQEKYNLSLEDICQEKGINKERIFAEMRLTEAEFLDFKSKILEHEKID